MSSPTSSSALPRAFLMILLFVLALNLGLVAPYLLAVFLGWIFATVLTPFFRWATRKLRRPKLAALLATLLATFTIILPIGAFSFLTVKNIVRVVEPYVKSGIDSDVWVARAQEIPLVTRVFDGPDELREFVGQNGKKVLAAVSAGATGVIAGLPEVALQLVLALLTGYFILVQGRQFREWMSPRIPLDGETQTALAKNLNDTAYSSFLSMFFAALAQSVVILVAFFVLKVPFATLAFGLAFIFAWFPIFGVTPVWLAALVYLLIVGRSGAAIGMVAFGIAVGLVDNIVRPWVLKGRADIHPLVSLVAIFGAIHFFGLIGVLVGPVAAGCAIEFLTLWPKFSEQLGLKPR